MSEIFKAWRDAGAYIWTKDGRCIPMKQLWEEVYDQNKEDWEEIFKDTDSK